MPFRIHKCSFIILLLTGVCGTSVNDLFAQADSARHWFVRADSLAKQKLYTKAIHWFDKAAQNSKDGATRLAAQEATRSCYECLEDYDNAFQVALLIHKENPTRKSIEAYLAECPKPINGSRLAFKEKMNGLPLYTGHQKYSVGSIRGEYDMMKYMQTRNLATAFSTYKTLKDFNRVLYYLMTLDFYVPQYAMKTKGTAAKQDSLAAEKFYAKSLIVRDSATWNLWKASELFTKTDSWNVKRIDRFAEKWKNDQKMKTNVAYGFQRRFMSRGEYNRSMDLVEGYDEREIVLAKAAAFKDGRRIKADERDSADAKLWFDQADRYFRSRRYDSAFMYFDKAAMEYFYLTDWESYIQSVVNSGKSLEGLTWTNFDYSGLHGLNTPYDYYGHALEVCQVVYPQTEQEANILYTLGEYFRKNDDPSEGLNYHELALNIHLKDPALHPDEGVIIFAMGNYYENENDYEKAIQFYRRALVIAENSGNNNLKADCLQGIAHNLYYSNNYDEALLYLDKSQNTNEPQTEKVKREAAINIVRGNIYSGLNKVDQSIDHYRKAMAYYKVKGDTANMLLVHYNAIQLLMNAGREPAASVMFNDAARLLDFDRITKPSATVLRERAISFLNFASTGQKGKKSTMEYVNRAIMLNHFQVVDLDDYMYGEWSEPDLGTPGDSPVDSYSSGELLLESYLVRADLLHDIFLRKKDLASLEKSIESYYKADTLINRMRTKAVTESAQLRISESAQMMCEEAIGVTTEAWAFTKNEKYKAVAFYFMERSKAGALRTALAEVNARASLNIPDSLLRKEKSIKTQINQISLQSAGADNEEIKSKASDQLFDLNRELAEILKKYEATYPQYYNLKHQQSVITLPQVRRQLANDLALIEYFLGYEKMFATVITKNKIEILTIPMDTMLTRNVNAMRKCITLQLGDEFVKYSSRVGASILQPVLKSLGSDIRKLQLVPDGILNYIPFELLVTDATFSDYAQLNYLIRDFEISYALSATLYYSTDHAMSTDSAKTCIAFAPVFSDVNNTNFLVKSCDRFYEGVNFENKDTRAFSKDGQYIAPLPATEDEVLKIAALLKDKNHFARYFLFQDAKEEVIKSEELERYQYIHFATHGMINDTNPELSGLLLSQDTANTEDGILYAGEIYGLKLNAELVTLSACETGLGKIVDGEGVMGLTRGWLYAGAKNIIVSLWKVADQSTSELMIYFYNELLEGASKPDALRKAKLKMLTHETYADPFYWAPFVLVGN